MKINNVLVVGGGTAGWMTAAALLKLCPHIKTSLIESSDYPIIGVGESTLGQINDFFALLELEDDQWMKDTGSTYKVNIRFNDFYKNGETWDYPFGTAQERLSVIPHGWMSWFALNLTKPEKFHRGTFATTFNSVGHLAYHNKLTNDDRHWNPKVDTAYHMDAIKFGQWLKNNYCMPRGLDYHQGNVVDCIKDEFGNITSLLTDDGRKFDYDLYIDCTGFKSLLLEGMMGEEFVSFHYNDGGCLLNDRAVTCHMPHEDPSIEISNTTNCTAINNGWVWDVPLWERSGVGYVHSSLFCEDPESELYDYLVKTRGKERADKTQMRTVPFKNGKHKRSWVKNVCAVGLSNCFVEPLEATGLLVTHEQIIRLCNNLAGRDGIINRAEVDMLNLVADLEIEGFKNFIAAHYAFSARETKYWRYVSDVIQYDFTTGALDNLFVRWASEKHVAYEFIGDPAHNDGLRYVGAGMGFNPLNNHTLRLKRLQNNLLPEVDQQELDTAELRIDEWNRTMLEWCNTLPSSYEFQKQTIYKE
jgi:tryptophan halogenase